jgi:di/tripeptidase
VDAGLYQKTLIVDYLKNLFYVCCMLQSDLDLLKEVLSVKTKTYREGLMVEYLTNYFTEKGYPFYLDHKNNVYVTKGEAEVFPCVIAHTDTVHNIKPMFVVERMGRRGPTYGHLPFNDTEDRLFLTGVDERGRPSGIGGDDKCGVYTCLRLLEVFDNLKAAFFVSEETGCHGSREADPNFFNNVGYTIQFDAPGNALVTEVCSFVRLFDRNSRFFEIVDATLGQFGEYDYQSHPYTDISQIKKKFDHACLNLSCGYYNMHSDTEYVDVEDVENTVTVGTALINNLGYQKYDYFFDYVAEEEKRRKEWQKNSQKWKKEMREYIREKYGKLPPELQRMIDEEIDAEDGDPSLFLN